MARIWKRLLKHLFMGFVFLRLIVAAERGDLADKPGVEQNLIVPREMIPPAPALSPSEGLKTFKLAPGLRIELVASDPLIGDPVAMNIGPDGRMWVVEMRSFMPDLDGNGEDQPLGRVVILQDTDGDGVMDKRTIFADKLVMPRAIMLVGDGALIGAPPKLWYCRDTNGDGHADEKIEVAGDYGTQVDPKNLDLANPERAPNSPLWALDNWVYSAAYTKRFRFFGGQWAVASTTFRGQFGLSQDDYGRLYYNSNSDQLRSDVLPSHYLGRNPYALRVGGTNVNLAESQFVWPARVNPGINRGYLPEYLRDYKLKAFTAACSPWIYRGDLLGPEFRGNAFVCEPAGNLVKRNIITEAGGTLVARDAYHEREFLASTDERFRPVSLYTGPDGALYVVDFHRGVIEHRISLTSYLRKQAEERGLDKPIGLGRIYRIVPDGAAKPIRPRLGEEGPEQWVNYLSHPNSWWRETAQRLLVERNDGRVVPVLRRVAISGSSPFGRLHALWTLDGMNQLDAPTVFTALKDRDDKVRASAVRLSESFLKSTQRAVALQRLKEMTGDDATLVQQQLVLTLGEAESQEADDAIAMIVRRSIGTAFVGDAAITGLFGRELELLERLLADAAWSGAESQRDRFLGMLARCVFVSRKSDRCERLLELVANERTRPKRMIALLDGLIEATASFGKRPVKLSREPAAFASFLLVDTKKTARIAALVTWPGKVGTKPEPPPVPLTARQMANFQLGKTLYGGVCAACHQLHGLGMEGLAPPLVDSEWVNGSEKRLVRIVLHGLTGPIKVRERTYNLDMPALGAFSDDQIAAILTYVRREWDHTANPVEPETVSAIRAANKLRLEGWRQEELLNIP